MAASDFIVQKCIFLAIYLTGDLWPGMFFPDVSDGRIIGLALTLFLPIERSSWNLQATLFT